MTPDFLLQHLLERSAASHPDRPAVSFAGRSLSYAELDDHASRVAVRLQEAGVGPGDRVGLMVRKGGAAVVSMLATLKAGAVYVPLDLTAPTSRLAYIRDDCGIRQVLATPGDGDADAIVVGDEPPDLDPGRLAVPPTIDTDLAYILYTSGSTGTPKGVMISHLNALTFIRWCQSVFEMGPEDRLANHAPLHFDLSVLDVYGALQAGACVCPVPEEIRSFPVRLAEWIAEERISIWYSVPSALTLLAQHGNLERVDLRRLRLCLFAGEVFPIKHLQDLAASLSGPRYFNLYGPTETNVCTFHEADLVELAGRTEPLPIGRACSNMGVFAVTDEGRQASVGEEGELLVRGSGVALGYWGLPERTAVSFVQNPLDSGRRDIVYRTGDVVVLQADGEYRYLGRRDQQVKIRGYRIELGEIESVIYGLESAKEAAVVAVPDPVAGSRLQAVVVAAAGATLTAAEVRAHCGRLLPPYMVPEAVEFVNELPRNANGKLDRGEILKRWSRA